MDEAEKAKLRQDLDWLVGEFGSLSWLAQSQFSCGSDDDATYARDIARADEIHDALRALLE